MQQLNFLLVCEAVIAKLQRKKQKIQEAESKPKRLLRSTQLTKELRNKKFNNPLNSIDNLPLIQYLPDQVRQSLLNLQKINVEMVNRIKIQLPVDNGLGIRNMKKALKILQQSMQSIPQFGSQKVIPTKSTIQQQKMEPQETYTLYLADRIQELCNIGVSAPNMVPEGSHAQFYHFDIKGMHDFYAFGNDRIF